MRALDFNYDDLFLSDFGCIICSFSDPGKEEYSVGSEITFETSSVNFGKTHYLASRHYDSCLTAEFDICKNVEHLNDKEERFFTLDEQRDLTRWLNRPNFHRLYIMDDGYEDTYFEGSFNLSKIEIAGNIIGFHLSFQSNRPFGLNEKYTKHFTIIGENQKVYMTDVSDEVGYSYADLTVICDASGDLTITNDMDNRVTEIKNCVSGETITIENMIIESDNASHMANIMNDFNFTFLRISNTFNNQRNGLTFSMPCRATISYSPIRKVGI